MVRAGARYGKDLYLLRMGELVKIGRSMDIRRRLGEHRRGNPWAEIALVAVFENSGFMESWVLKRKFFCWRVFQKLTPKPSESSFATSLMILRSS
jgi:hypothetical protein